MEINKTTECKPIYSRTRKMGFSFETSLVEQMNEQHINNMN